MQSESGIASVGQVSTRRSGDASLIERKRRSTPSEFAAYLRAQGDLYFWPAGGFWVVTSYELARRALRNPTLSCDRSSFFISRMPDLDLSLIGDFFAVIKRMMVMSDAPEHTERRGVAVRAFESGLAHVYPALVHRAVEELLASLADRPRVDLLDDVARILPFTVLAEIFGIAGMS